jgi:hypothetical protein
MMAIQDNELSPSAVSRCQHARIVCRHIDTLLNGTRFFCCPKGFQLERRRLRGIRGAIIVGSIHDRLHASLRRTL